MPLFEIETDAHIIITWAADESSAGNVVREAYPGDKVIRLTKRPRDTWVISKGALGLASKKVDVCTTARDFANAMLVRAVRGIGWAWVVIRASVSRRRKLPAGARVVNAAPGLHSSAARR